MAEVASFLSGLGAAHLPTVALALPLLAGHLIGTRLRPTWPIPMIGMIVATAAVATFSLDDLGVRLVGSAVSGLPVPGLPALSAHDVVSLLLPAVGGRRLLGQRAHRRAFAARGETCRAPPSSAPSAPQLAAGLLRGTGEQRRQRPRSATLEAAVHSALAGRPRAGSRRAGWAAPLLSVPKGRARPVVIFAALRLIDVASFRRIARFRRTRRRSPWRR